MILVYDQILDRVKNIDNYKDVYAENECKSLIENFIDSNLQSVSYDLTISNQVLIFKDNGGIINLNDNNQLDSMTEELDIKDGYLLKPNEYIIVKLNEKINMPDDLVAHLRPRTSFNKIGLIITNQHINPSYSGRLQFGVKNMTNNVMKIVPGLKIGQVIFETLGGKVRDEKLYRNNKSSKYQGEDDFVKSKIYQELDKGFLEHLNTLK